jgi:hypothetical protein
LAALYICAAFLGEYLKKDLQIKIIIPLFVARHAFFFSVSSSGQSLPKYFRVIKK